MTDNPDDVVKVAAGEMVVMELYKQGLADAGIQAKVLGEALESSFSSFESTGSGGSSSSAFSKLGIKPIHWLSNPHVVGTDSVAGDSRLHRADEPGVHLALTRSTQ